MLDSGIRNRVYPSVAFAVPTECTHGHISIFGHGMHIHGSCRAEATEERERSSWADTSSRLQSKHAKASLGPSVLMGVQRLEAAGVPHTDISIVPNNSDEGRVEVVRPRQQALWCRRGSKERQLYGGSLR